MAPTVADLEAAGLYDPDAPDAAARLELLEYLIGLGAALDDLLSVDELPVLAADLRMWRSRARYTAAEIAARAGVPETRVRRMWRAVGFPEPGPADAVFAGPDVAMLATLDAGAQLLGDDVVVQIARVVAASAARVADAAVSAFVVGAGADAIARDASGLALARVNAEAIDMLDQLRDAFDVLMRHHVEALRRPLADGMRSAGGFETRHATVGFVDLVGSSALGAELAIGELGAALAAFDELASEIVVAHGGRTVKFIGDEVMFVAEPAAAVRIACELVHALDAHPVLPEARGGVATGDLLLRDGDYFGPTVNLAARAVKLASPSTVLVCDATRAALEGAGRPPVDDAGEHRLRGLDEPVHLWRVAGSVP